MRILIVSGGPAVTAQITTGLIGEDFESVEVRTPQRGVAVLDSDDRGFDLVIGDNDTNPTGGFYLAQDLTLRRRMGKPAPPLILVLARAQDNWLAKWAQADAWVVKPVDPFDLAETVHALVAGAPVPRLPGVGTVREQAALSPGQERISLTRHSEAEPPDGGQGVRRPYPQEPGPAGVPETTDGGNRDGSGASEAATDDASA